MIQKKSYLFAAIAICFWGSTAAVASLLLESLHTIAVLFFNCTFASVCLFCLNAVSGRLRQLKSMRIRELLSVCALGFLGMFVYNLLLYIGLSRLLAQQAFIINYLWPILTVLFSCFFLQRKLTIRTGLALLVSFAGVMIVATEGKIEGLMQVDLLGVLASLGAAVSYALYSVLNMKYIKCDKYLSTMLCYGTAAVVSLLLLPTIGQIQFPSGIQWVGLLWTGILTNGVAYTMWALALDKGDTAKISNLAYITPFLSLIYSYVLLHETIHPASFLGLGAIVSGILIQSFQIRKKAE